MAFAESEQLVTLILEGPEASELKSLLMDKVSWDGDRFGKTAEAIYDALTDAGVSEA